MSTSAPGQEDLEVRQSRPWCTAANLRIGMWDYGYGWHMRALAWHDKRDVRPDTVHAPDAYEMFQKKEDGMIKAMFHP